MSSPFPARARSRNPILHFSRWIASSLVLFALGLASPVFATEASLTLAEAQRLALERSPLLDSQDFAVSASRHIDVNAGTAERQVATVEASSPVVTEAWARATVPGQAVGAAYMKISASSPVSLIYVETEMAKQVQVHNMRMQGGVMQMREHSRLEIPAGKVVSLAPGGMHLMLVGLKKSLKAGDTIPLRMTFVDEKNIKSLIVVAVSVRPFGK